MSDMKNISQLNETPGLTQPDLSLNRDRLRRKNWKANLTSVYIGLGDILLINAAILIGYHLRFTFEFGVQSGWVQPFPKAPIKEYLKALLFIDYLFLVLFNLFQLYRRDRARWIVDEIHTLIKCLSLGFVILTSLTFFIRMEKFEYSRMVILFSFIISVIFLPLWRYLVLKIERRRHLKGKDISRVVIIGSGEMTHIVARKLMTNAEVGYRIIGFMTPELQKLYDIEGYPYLGSLKNFGGVLVKNQIDEVFISEEKLSHFSLLEIVSTCESLGVLVRMVPNVFDLLIDFADMSELDGLPLVAVREQPMYELSLLSKRIYDIVLSGLFLLFSAPVCILIIILIKLDSPGSVFFVQKRAGVGGKPFNMIKFRTMFVDAESRLKDLINLAELEEPVFKIKDDPRITRVGRFLRRTSLDEIPQFWNVLKGDMSLVGPRPEETQLVDKYNIWQRRRLKIKPGITGMQQIMCRGTTSLSDRVHYDIYYLRKHSLLLDTWIILRTIPVVISGKGAY